MATLKKFGAFLLLSFLLLPGIAGASGQDSINELIKNGGNVTISGTYTLTGPITLTSDLRLNGQNSTIITIPDSADWDVWVPLMKGTGLHNVTIEGIEFNVNADGNDEIPHGRGYYNCIHLISCSDIIVRDCAFHDGKGDGLRTKYCSNVKFYNNVAYKLGHDCFFGIDSENISAWNNTLTTRTNSGLRIWNSKDVQFFCNRINAQLDSLGGNPGIQIEDSKGTMDNVRVFANTINETWGAGIWLISYDSGSDNCQNITIDHNRILKDGASYNIYYTAGITIDGVQGTNISNNVFDSCNNAGILILDGGEDTKIEKNIIINTDEHPAISQSGTGYGINNRRNSEISISNNCFFNNFNGNVFRADSIGDDLQDPTVHNTSSGWTWNGIEWLCDYVISLENDTVENSIIEDVIYEDIADTTDSTCINDTNSTDLTNLTNITDTDLHEIIYVPIINNTCPLKNVTENVTACNVTVCNKSTVVCPSIYDVPIIEAITGDFNNTKNNSCVITEKPPVNEVINDSVCGDIQFKLVVIDYSQSETDFICGSGGNSNQSTVNNSVTEIPANQSQTQDVPYSESMPGGLGGGASITSDETDNETLTTVPGVAGPAEQNESVEQNESAEQNETVIPTPEPVLPIPGFTTDPSNGSGTVPLTINFHSTARNAVITKWDFGDVVDNEATGTDVSHTYKDIGTYNVTQTVINQNGTLTASARIHVNRVLTPAVADFEATPASGNAPIKVDFTDKSQYTTMPESTVMYDFGGDEGSSSDRNTSHVYNTPGIYQVTQTVTNPDSPAGGDIKEITITVTGIPTSNETSTGNETPTSNGTSADNETPTVDETPVTLMANFEANRTGGIAPLSVAFADASTDAITYEWDFGDDAGKSTEQNPSYVFTRAGNYDVVLTVGDGKGHIATKDMQITVTSTPIVADFDANKTSGFDPLTVQFTDKSTGAVSWQWNLGDDSPAVITRDAEHTFNVGTWTVNLTVRDGTNFASKTMTISVAESPVPLTADFVTDKSGGEAPCEVQFADASEGGATAWSWDFGDGTESIEKNPKHTFTAEGNYDVVLTVSDGKGNLATKDVLITITETPAVVSAFSQDRTGGESPLTIHFSEESQNAVSYEWVFGDGNTSTDQNPSHTFTAEGDYTVIMTATGSNGDKSTSQATIIVTGKLQPSTPEISDLNGTNVTDNFTLSENSTFSDNTVL